MSEPSGNYDYIEIIVTLISTDSLLSTYFLNSSVPNYCRIGYSVIFTMFKTSPYVVTMNNLCMLSTYNVTTTTNQIGYETVNYSVKFKTSNKNEFQNPFSKF